jgi:hypothetical protein
MSRKFAAALLAMIGLAIMGTGLSWAQDDEEGPMSNMHFVVVRDTNGKPIQNAAVVLHPVKSNGKQALGGMELKTNEDGKTGIDGIPYGKLRVQALAPGFQTFGDDYQINKPEMEITIRLKRPVRQVTNYDAPDSNNKKTDDKKADDKKTSDAPSDKKPDNPPPQ